MKNKKAYKAPVLDKFGTIVELTHVGQTNPGDDVLPGNAKGKDGGSINPDGLA